MVDLMCLQQSYKRREIAEIKWINRGSNPADAITKLKPYQALKDLINTNTIKLQVTKWVKRIGDKEGNISNLVNQSTGKNNHTLPSHDHNLPPCNGNLPLSTIFCYFLPAP